MMKQLIYALALAIIMPLSGCAQKNPSNIAEKSQLPAGVKVVELSTAVAQDKLLDAIVAPYKGKVVVLDFWATWCRPCMMAMQSIDPIKEKYLKEKKDVVFVYVASENSPKETWQSTIPGIKGYHYRLTNDQMKFIGKKLGLRGIPSYMVYNKNGSLAWDNIATGGYPGDDVITTTIDKALGK